jgi:hypothetical protein
MQYMKLRHQVTSATWNDVEGVWAVTVEDLQTGLTFVDAAEVLINNSGVLKYVLPPVFHVMADSRAVTGGGQIYRGCIPSRARYAIQRLMIQQLSLKAIG